MMRRKNPIGQTVIEGLISGTSAALSSRYIDELFKGKKKNGMKVKNSQEKYVVKIRMKQVESGEEKKYEYKFESKETALKKINDFVNRSGKLWKVDVLIEYGGEVVWSGVYDASRKIWDMKKTNPMEMEEIDNENSAEEMSEKFHGRPAKEWFELEESIEVDDELAVLGVLTEIELRAEEDKVVPIEFGKPGVKDIDPEQDVLVCTNPEGTQLYLVGGDQDLSENLDELKDLGVKVEDRVMKVNLGEVYSISYYTDKHHLSGPKSQKDGAHYVHKLGEVSGIEPQLVLDKKSGKLEFIGGDYEVRDVGIWN